MRVPVIIVATCLLSMVGCSKGTNSSGQGQQGATPAFRADTTVEADYKALKNALRDGDGETAASLVTASTLQEYEICRKLALDSSGTDFADLNQFTVLMVFQLRYLLERSRLAEMTGRDIFIWGVTSGMVKKETIEAIAIHKVQYDGSTAYATLTQNGQVATDALFTFRNEDSRWKLDMMEIARMGGKQLDSVREQARKTKVEMAVYLLERTYGAGIPPSILDGPLK